MSRRNSIARQYQNPEGSCDGQRVHARGRKSAGGGYPDGGVDKPTMMAYFMCIEYVHIERLGLHQRAKARPWLRATTSCHVALRDGDGTCQRPRASQCHKNPAPAPEPPAPAPQPLHFDPASCKLSVPCCAVAHVFPSHDEHQSYA